VDTKRFALHPLAAPINLGTRLRDAWVSWGRDSDASQA
jgi:hypothetical protein